MSTDSTEPNDSDNQPETLEEKVERALTQSENNRRRMDALSRKLTHFKEDLLGIETWSDEEEDAILDRVEELEHELETTKSFAKVEADEIRRSGSKVRLAKEIARNSIVQEAKGNGGKGSIDSPAVETAAKAQGIKISTQTVHDAFDDLEEQWDGLFVRDGDPGPHGDNTELRCDLDAVEPALIEAVDGDL